MFFRHLFVRTLLKNVPDFIDPYSNFVFYGILCSLNFFGRPSPRWYSRGSPGGWIKFCFTKLVDKYHRKIQDR